MQTIRTVLAATLLVACTVTVARADGLWGHEAQVRIAAPVGSPSVGGLMHADCEQERNHLENHAHNVNVAQIHRDGSILADGARR